MPPSPVVPPKLRPGDLIRVVAPSLSLAMLAEELHATSTQRLESLGLRVSFGRRVREIDELDSSSVTSRVADLREAFEDPDVRGVLTVIGGFNANQLLRSLDWRLIARNPKVFCGYSDITVLQNAMLARAGLLYSGPHFSTYAMVKGIEYDLAGFRRCCMEDGPFEVEPSTAWSDDAWYLDQENRDFVPNPVRRRYGRASPRGGSSAVTSAP